MSAKANRRAFRGGHIVVHELGSGPTVGYLHGIYGNPRSHPALAALADGHHVIAPTLPGFNDSPSCPGLRGIYDWVAAVSEIVDLADIAGRPMVASSVGAMLALETASVRPEAFSSLTLIAPFGLWRETDPIADLYARPAIEEQAMLTVDPSPTDTFWRAPDGLSTAEQVEAGVERYLTRTTAASLIWGVPDHGLESRLHRVTCPVTLIWGAEDRLIPSSYIDYFADALPNVADCHVIEDAGHQVEWDQPETVAKIVMATIHGGGR